MFQGAASFSVDAKGRLTVPARFRDALLAAGGGGLVVTAHPHGCLVVYPETAWAVFRDRVLAMPRLDQKSAYFRRLFVGFAEPAQELDGAGRIAVPASLRRHAGIERNVLVMGQGDHFEVWSEERWASQQELMQPLLDGAPPTGWEAF